MKNKNFLIILLLVLVISSTICYNLMQSNIETFASEDISFNKYFEIDSAYRVGLTATPERKDGMQKALFLHIGPIVYEMEGHKRVPTIWRINTE